MTPDNPLLLGGLCIVVAWLAKLWADDLRLHRSGGSRPTALPGAVPVGFLPIGIAVAGSLVLLGVETFGELSLGIAGEQSTVTWLFGLYTLAAAFGEELVFRGYFVVAHRGRAWLWVSVILFSLLFAVLHPFLWEWQGDGEGLVIHPDLKGAFSTAVVFVGSLWFYAVRFFSLNPNRSLLPSISAHLAKNLGVFLIKLLQGFVSGLW
ncbi:MAG: CPBP family intramembrane metalloprotease [Verrucomicrobia bacterium]|nr:MAG: CPBP family intramembrane metalloprotease [Verrucomicrobiota bacterium]